MPSKSKAQHEAMCAAAKGKSKLGIPREVGEEFCEADKGKKFEKEHASEDKGKSRKKGKK